MEFILGVDCSKRNTKATLFKCENNSRVPLGHFLGEAINFDNLNDAVIRKLLFNMIEDFKIFDIKPSNTAIGIGIEECFEPSIFSKFQTTLKYVGFKEYKVTDSGHIALLAAHKKQDGLLLVCDTESFIYAMKDDHLYKKGNWGYLLNNESSGYALGLSLLKHLFDCIDSNTEFPKDVLTHIYVKTRTINLEELLKWTYTTSQHNIAKIAEIAIKHSEVDSLCNSLVENTINKLEFLAEELRTKTNLNKISFSGKFIQNDTFLKQKLIKRILQNGFEFHEKSFSNEFGATLLFDF